MVNHKARWLDVVIGAALVLFQIPAAAHHSFSAEFDADNPVIVTGPLTKVEWTNPHARIHVAVADGSGGAAAWDFELGTPSDLTRGGWTRDSVKVGDTVTVRGFAARNGSHVASARSVILADGRTVFAR